MVRKRLHKHLFTPISSCSQNNSRPAYTHQQDNVIRQSGQIEKWREPFKR